METHQDQPTFHLFDGRGWVRSSRGLLWVQLACKQLLTPSMSTNTAHPAAWCRFSKQYNKEL
jgi:hypothetical protein